MASDIDNPDDQGGSQPMGLSERRRAIFERTVLKFAAAGFRIDTDPVFVAHINQWIAGDVEMHDAAARYESVLRQRRSGVQLTSAADVASASSDAPEAVLPTPDEAEL